ncbi:Hypothetical predicted protein [Marmota monax]|uniref:Uncharacterized protein n=1 Tax=Marmota monax TaxID=9995 RepID=A0A5E4CLN0_MARMO|nr:hypothetical protein GHT09_011366 [Marmota monax]VTJ82738.1 Hypothetical predicted protein [Marmota monax]
MSTLPTSTSWVCRPHPGRGSGQKPLRSGPSSTGQSHRVPSEASQPQHGDQPGQVPSKDEGSSRSSYRAPGQ